MTNGEVIEMKKLPILLILLMFAIPVHPETVYKWVDEKGVINFTDDYKKVPLAFRNGVKTEEYLEEKPPVLSHEMPKNVDQEVRAEGRDYWSKQLEEAISDYEKVREELLQEGERLVSHRYGSKTQYQMFTAELPGITQRLESYREQMIEAKVMLDKFTTETQETEDSQGDRAVSSLRNGDTQTDRYGRDERWWKEKVRPWKEQLEEATQNYEEICEAFVKRAEGLGPFMFGRLSLTQYQMISSRLTELSGQMTMYESQIAEAKDMLSRLSKEAEETGADPAWLE
jgi:hypothetical protein